MLFKISTNSTGIFSSVQAFPALVRPNFVVSSSFLNDFLLSEIGHINESPDGKHQQEKVQPLFHRKSDFKKGECLLLGKPKVNFTCLIVCRLVGHDTQRAKNCVRV